MFLYMVFFGGLNSSIPWTYQNEVFPLNARARGTALSTSTNWFTNFWLGLYILQALNKASWKVYFVFGAVNIVVSFIGFLFFPETARRTLEELGLLFTPDRSVFVFHDKDACRKGSMLEHKLTDDPEALASELDKKLISVDGRRASSSPIYEQQGQEKFANIHTEKAVTRRS